VRLRRIDALAAGAAPMPYSGALAAFGAANLIVKAVR